jgi:hypothetical protein
VQCASKHHEYLLEQNRVFFPVTSGHQRVPARVKPISDEVFKSVICDLVKVCSDTALQWHFVGDGQGPPSVAGVGLLTSALTDGSQPSAEVLNCQCLHDVKGMLDSKAYLKNPNSSNAAQARAQTMVLDSINSLMNGEQHWNPNQNADNPSDLNPNNVSVGLNNRSAAASNA